jgi:ribosomal protein S18 acetylase RimI-like enzyme
MMTIQVQAAHSNERQLVIRTLVRAFADDPAARWMYPQTRRYFEFFPHFVEAFGGPAFESGRVDQVGGHRGAALWLPPGIHPDDDAVSALIERSVPERDRAALFSLFEAMGRYHPSEPHWHLPLIGVEPRAHYMGYGSALLREALARCDEAGELAYLESSNPRNISLYRRHGFEVLGTIQVGSSPPITPMLRRPDRKKLSALYVTEQRSSLRRPASMPF